MLAIRLVPDLLGDDHEVGMELVDAVEGKTVPLVAHRVFAPRTSETRWVLVRQGIGGTITLAEVRKAPVDEVGDEDEGVEPHAGMRVAVDDHRVAAVEIS